jgi:proteasome activator subunit 4
MVPLEDCSSFSDREDLTDEQRELCLASSGFEEFALQCFERCLMYITNSTNDHGRHDSGSREIGERMTHEEKFMRLGMSSLVGTIIYQSSDQICQSVLQRLFNFVSNRHLSYNHYTGATVASFCAVAMKLRPSVAQGEIFEPILKLLKNRVSLAADELVNNEELDEEIAWTVKLTAESLSSSGRSVIVNFYRFH